MPCLLPKIYKKLIKNEMVLSGYIKRSTYIDVQDVNTAYLLIVIENDVEKYFRIQFMSNNRNG